MNRATAVLSWCVAILIASTIGLAIGGHANSTHIDSLTVQERALEREVDQLQAQAATATVASAPQPLATWQDENTTSCAPDLVLLDHKSTPAWWVLNCGGMWVGNDKIGVAGTQNYNQAIYMWTPDGVHGALVIDGWTLKAKDVVFLLCLETHTEPTCRAHYSRVAQVSRTEPIAPPAYP